ncbi:MAG: type I restriction enzyme HsdR N-terminal domain-containing protein [Nitrospiraceae bacterium]
MDKTIKKSLQQYAQIFHDGRQRNINEADSVMYLTKFFTDVLGYDLFSEITKEFQVRDRYCDIAVKVEGQVRFLLEAKAMPLALSDRHIEQAENYAARSGIQWVLLTNGLSWRLYHLTFETTGIEHDLVFDINLNPDSDLEEVWKCLYLLSRESLVRGELEDFWIQKKSLSPDSLVRALFTEEVLGALRRELRRKSEARLELTDVAASLRRLLNPEVLTEDIKIRKAKRKRKKSATVEGGSSGADKSEDEHMVVGNQNKTEAIQSKSENLRTPTPS